MRTESCYIAVLSFLCVACASSEGSEFPIRRFPVQAPPGQCAANPAADTVTPRQLSTAELQANRYALRFSILKRTGAAGQPVTETSQRDFSLVCDRIVAPGGRLKFGIPQADLTKVSVRVEAFSDAKLVYSGDAHEVDPRSATGATIMLHSTGSDAAIPPTTCNHFAQVPRAFHTATLLPNGHVVVIGGIRGDGGRTVDTNFVAETSVEIFDPTTLRWMTPEGSGQVEARAAHAAVLLPSPPTGPYEVLLIGGIAADPDSGIIGRKATVGDAFPMLVPRDGAKPAPWAIFTYTPGTPGSPGSASYRVLDAMDFEAPLFPAVTTAAGGTQLLVSGGATSFSNAAGFADPEKLARWIKLESREQRGLSPETFRRSTLTRLRAGQATALIGNQSVVLGGNMDGDELKLTKELAELLPSEGEGNATLVGVDGVAPTAWHALTPVSDTQLLWSGGFRVRATDPVKSSVRDSSDSTLQGAATASLRLVSISDQGQLAVQTPADIIQQSFEPTAYHRSLRLHDGSVLLSGGNRAALVGRGRGKCVNDQGETRYCALSQMQIFSVQGGSLTPRANVPQMGIPRYAHQVTRLLDNTILVTGGLTYDGGLKKPVIVSNAEIYNPNDGSTASDAFGRQPGQVMSPCPEADGSEFSPPQ